MSFGLLWFYVQELPKAQLAVVLVLKRLRRRVHGLKSHPTDLEKPGIEPATPGLQDIGLSPTPCGFTNLITWVVGVSPNLITWVVGIYSFAKLKKMNFTCH